MEKGEFKIHPFLGRKTNVSQDDQSLFRIDDDKLIYTHDVGGVNFDLTRKRGTCSKSKGYTQWGSTIS